MGNGILARSPRCAISVWKLFGAKGPLRSVAKTCADRAVGGAERVSHRPAGPANLQAAGSQLNLMPLEVAQLGSAQTVPIGVQDHSRIAAPFT